MQRVAFGWAAAMFGSVLAASASAQVNQLSFRGANAYAVSPAQATYAQISDTSHMVLASGQGAPVADSLAPIPQATHGVLSGGVPAAPQVSAPPSPVHAAPSVPAPSPVYSLHDDMGMEGGYVDCADGSCAEPDCGIMPCGTACGGECVSCCGPGSHATSVYGGYLYMRARDAEVGYAVPIDGPIVGPQANSPIQIGNFGTVDPDYDSGYYGGLTFAFDSCTSLDVRYTAFDSSTTDAIATQAPDVLRSLVAHPSSTSAAQDFLSAQAALDIEFDIIDASFRHLWNCGSLCPINTVIGARYAGLDQRFDTVFAANGTEQVTTDIDFDGAGLRLGLEAARFHCNNQMFLYANGATSLLAGRFRGSYFQGQSFDPTVVQTEWTAGRVVPILDLEAGIGWASRGGKLRLNAGYLFSGWYNVVKTEEWIRSVRNNDVTEISDTLTFDGLNARAELRF